MTGIDADRLKEEKVPFTVEKGGSTILVPADQADALRIMNENAVSVIFVEDDGRLIGVVHMHDIVKTGIV